MKVYLLDFVFENSKRKHQWSLIDSVYKIILVWKHDKIVDTMKPEISLKRKNHLKHEWFFYLVSWDSCIWVSTQSYRDPITNSPPQYISQCFFCKFDIDLSPRLSNHCFNENVPLWMPANMRLHVSVLLMPGIFFKLW